MNELDTSDKNILLDLLFCLFLIAMLVVFFVAVFGYSPLTRRAPMVVMIPLAAMLLGQTVITTKKFNRLKSASPVFSFFPKDLHENFKKGVQVLAWLVFLLLVIYLAGHIAGIALFLLIFLRFVSKESWLLAVSVSTGIPIAMHILFEKFLMIQLYQGFIYIHLSDWLQV